MLTPQIRRAKAPETRRDKELFGLISLAERRGYGSLDS